MTRTLLSSLIVSSLVAVSAASCVGGKPIGGGQDCPCAPGWTCDLGVGNCVPGTAGTGGPVGTAGTGGPGSGGMSGDDDTPPVAPGCGAVCGTPAGAVQPLASVDAVYTIMRGRWQFCGGAWQKAVAAPADAIGVEYAPASRALRSDGAPVGGKMYYLVAGPSGPERGKGFAYQLTYDVVGSGDSFQISMHPAPNSGFFAVARYSPCPTELELRLFYEPEPTTLVRFAPGDGVAKDGGVDTSPGPDGGVGDGSVIGDGGVASYLCEPLPPGTPDTCGEAPRTFWGWTTSAPPTDSRYPVGCSVVFPVQNPYYPGPNQACECTKYGNPSATPSWGCPI